MAMRGIRGAVNVRRNGAAEIFGKTQELLRAIMEENDFELANVAAAFFTMTPDLDADFPAHAARKLGWTEVPMMCSVEIGVPGAMKRVIRVLILVDSNVPASKIRHQYLGDTPCLRPDLAKEGGERKAPKSYRRS